MGKRAIVVTRSAAEQIARISLFIESKGMVATAEKFSDTVYNFFEQLADDKRTFARCRDPLRSALGYKCVSYKKRYVVVFIESEDEIVICELIASKMIKWE